MVNGNLISLRINEIHTASRLEVSVGKFKVGIRSSKVVHRNISIFQLKILKIHWHIFL